MAFDRNAWRQRWKSDNPDKTDAQRKRDNAARRAKRETETPEEREARLEKSRAKHKAWRDANPDKVKTYRDADRKKNRDRINKSVRSYALRTTYGITLAEYEAMLTSQGNCCAICKNDKASAKHSRHSWRVDHCHATGKVRALLCHNCNIALGLLKESTKTLQSMIDYLNRHTLTHGGNTYEACAEDTDHRGAEAQVD